MVLNTRHSIYIFLLLALALRLASGVTANISYVIIFLLAIRGREQALQALFLSWLFSMLNGALFPDAPIATVARYVVLLAAAYSMMSQRSGDLTTKYDKSLVVLSLLFGTLIIIHSLYYSSMPDVSVLKAISWTTSTSILLAGWAGLPEERRDHLSRQLFGGLTLVTLGSIAVLPFPAAHVSGVGFMGILGHSQSFGITMALLGAWSAVRAVAMTKPPWALILMIPVCMVLIILSGTRTAALSLLLGVSVSLLLGPVLSGQRIRQLMPGLLSKRLLLIVYLALVGMTVAWPKLVEQSESFIAKNAGAGSIGDAYEKSRGALIDDMWMNIEKHPFQGIGFGIATIPDSMIVIREPVFNLPTSAIVEKGVLPVAVLEELGIFGFIFFAFWLIILMKRCARRGVPALAVFLVAILLNMGEAILFSAGGMGMLAMFMIAWAATGVPLNSRRS